MFEDRSLKLDLCALALLALVVFLGVALWTYDATDPPSTLVWPPSDVVHNACGRAGAFTAHYLFESLGFGAYYLAGSLAVLTFLLFRAPRNRSADAPHVGLGDFGRRPHDARRAGHSELDARPGRRRRRLHRRDGPQLAGIPLRPGRRVHLRAQRAARRPAALDRLLPVPRRGGDDAASPAGR